MTHPGRESAAGSPLSIRVIAASHHRTMPWKNGFGTTTEIAIDPPDADLGGRFRWRLSIASVQRSGPFSAFPGYERTIMVIEGRGMELTVGSDPPRRLDRLFEPFVFSGDSPAHCRLLGGPIRDFNLIVDRSRLRSRMCVWRAPSAPPPIDLSSAEHIIHCFGGAVDLALRSAAWSCELQANETAAFRQRPPADADLQIAPVAGAPATLAVIALAAGAAGQAP